MSKHQPAANIFWFVLIVGPFVAGLIAALSILALELVEPGFMGKMFSLMDYFQAVGIGLIGGLGPCFIAAMLCYFWVRRTGRFSYLGAALTGFVATLIFYGINPFAVLPGREDGDLPSFEWQGSPRSFKLAMFGVSSALVTRWLMGRFGVFSSNEREL